MKFWLSLMCTVSALWAGEPSAAQIRQAATKAVAIIQHSQQGWYTKQSCASCHQQMLPALAFRAAREHGIPVDEKAAHADAAAAFGHFADFERAVERSRIIDPGLDDAFEMMAANAAGVRPSLATAASARFLAARQESDGHWETADERPPQAYSRVTATAVSLRAIQLYAHPSQKADVAARAGRTRAWLLSRQPRATEERAYQLLGARWAGADQATLRKLTAALMATQQDDGGWNSVEGRSSDAYSTGQALVALHDAGGVAVTGPAWHRGIDWLVRTQAPDGSWHVTSRLHPPAPVSPPYFETGYPYGHDQFISAMGESFALMALAEALGPAKPSPVTLHEAAPQAVEPWAETLLFGSAADVKKLIESGFDPNSTTKVGGVTALMLATPDVEKMKLLIDRGADVEARSKSKYSALLVAAQYPNSSAAMNLLLDRGAQVRLPKGHGAPLFNAFPVFLAAYSGNGEIIPRLVREGDRVDDRMIVIGFLPYTPMLFLATTTRTGSVGALLDAGVNVDEVDSSGLTPLAWTAISNRVEMARLLIERGADVNHVDLKGMTPLLYAASIDYGDPAMIELLLKSGARKDARTTDGLTALDLARKYHHTNLLASLEEPRAAR